MNYGTGILSHFATQKCHPIPTRLPTGPLFMAWIIKSQHHIFYSGHIHWHEKQIDAPDKRHCAIGGQHTHFQSSFKCSTFDPLMIALISCRNTQVNIWTLEWCIFTVDTNAIALWLGLWLDQFMNDILR